MTDKLKLELVGQVRNSIPSNFPVTIQGHFVDFLPTLHDPLLVSHIRIRTNAGPRYFEVRLKETY